MGPAEDEGEQERDPLRAAREVNLETGVAMGLVGATQSDKSLASAFLAFENLEPVPTQILVFTDIADRNISQSRLPTSIRILITMDNNRLSSAD